MYGLETIRKLNEKTTSITTAEVYCDTGTVVGSGLCQCSNAEHQAQEKAESSNSNDNNSKDCVSELPSFIDSEVKKRK